MFPNLTCTKNNQDIILSNHIILQLSILDIECHSNPCQNGGICTDAQTTGHTCHCPGFTGNNCEKGITNMTDMN